MALIWVKATELGFDGMQRRKEGERFQIEEKKFSERWMKKVKPPREEDDELEPEVQEKREEKMKAKAGRASDKSPI